MVTGLLLVTGLLAFLLVIQPAAGVKFLNSAQLDKALKPGLITRLGWQVRPWIGARLQKFRRRRTGLQIDARWFTFSNSTFESIGLGTPSVADAGGMRAWIYPAPDPNALVQQLKHAPGADLEWSPNVQMADYGSAVLFQGSNILRSSGPTPIGRSVTFTPRYSGRILRLTARAFSTQLGDRGAVGGSDVTTNFDVACQAWLTNHSSLLVDTGRTNAAGRTCWLLIFATLYDPRGQPLNW
jgi:hypothetical protein